MDKETRNRLEAAGFRIGSAAEFLGLSPAEQRLVNLRLAASRLVRERRAMIGMTQKELASEIQSSQSRVAKIEAGEADVSLDLIFKAAFALGARASDLTSVLRAGEKKLVKPKRKSTGHRYQGQQAHTAAKDRRQEIKA